MHVYHASTPAFCPSCQEHKQDFVWDVNRTMICTDCATPKVDWAGITLEFNLGYRHAPCCGRMRRHFVTASLCLKCHGQQAADNLIASGPLELLEEKQ